MVTIFLALTLAGLLAIATVICATVYHWSHTDQHRDHTTIHRYTRRTMSSPDTAPVSNEQDRDWWTPREFADHAGLSLNYVRKRLHYGDIPFEKVPDAGLQNVRISKTDGQAWIDRPPKDWGLTHQWVANKTGFSRSGVSRMRSNTNTDAPVPKARMQKIEDAFGWTVRDQGIAWAEGRWVTEFERVLTDAYAKEHGS